MSPLETIQYRDALDEDGPAIAGLIRTIFGDYPGVAFVAAEFPELMAPAGHFRARGGRLFVGEAAGRLIACFGAAPTHDRHVAELLKVYVDRSFRGRGVAARLLAMALDWADDAGATSISLWSDVKFVEGHRFYLHHGFSRGPGVRALHDQCQTLEINFRLDLSRREELPAADLR